MSRCAFVRGGPFAFAQQKGHALRYVVLVAMVVLTASCGSLGGPVRPPVGDDYARLAKHVLDNTPEHTHFVKGIEFEWCLFIPPKDDPLPQLAEEVLKRLGKKYAVYLTEEDIPPSRKIYRGGQLAGFQGGFLFRYEIEALGPARIRIHYSDWEGLLAASRHSVTYEWNGKSWKATQKSTMAVS